MWRNALRNALGRGTRNMRFCLPYTLAHELTVGIYARQIPQKYYTKKS